MRKTVFVLVSLSLIFSFLTLFFTYGSQNIVTGHILFGSVSLYILSDAPIVTIHSPLNTTYYFSIGSNYTLDLNVSATGPNNISYWWYTLEDLFHNTVVNQSVTFSPNISFNAVRRSNKLTIYANDTAGQVGSKSVIFYVSVPNSAPLLGNITPDIYVCEGNSLSYAFNATDVDEEDLTVSLSPTNPFFVFPTDFSGAIHIYPTLFSGILQKIIIGNLEEFNRTISVTDGQYSDSKNVTIHVIETNDAPILSNIGVQTVYTSGDNSTFYHQLWANDMEDGNSDGGNLEFNISFNGGPFLFNISEFGVMNFTPNDTQIGVYNITVCATDLGLPILSVNASFCNETGASKFSCLNFSLTVTDDNRVPTIVEYFPTFSSFNATGGQMLEFNITSYDPDGTIPDAYWYLDGAFVEYTQGNLFSEYKFSYPCGVSGTKTMKAEITDGLANDSMTWTIYLTAVACSVIPPKPAGGGGGGGGPSCFAQWGCNDWQVCQNVKSSLAIGLIAQEDYREIIDSCAAMGVNPDSCGYQTRYCFDNKFCNSTISKPDFIQACLYTENPGCYDGIKNCHSGACELLVDCGGPCNQCPSCSDGVKNQGEFGIDCGGPCPFVCPAENPFISFSVWRTILIWLFWLLLLILLIILMRRIWRLIQVHRELQKESRIQAALSK